MKKILQFLFLALAISCSKEQITSTTGDKVEMSVEVQSPVISAADTKADLHNVIVYNFNEGDAISVIDLNTSIYLGDLYACETTGSAISKMESTKFSGTLTGTITAGDKLAFIYPSGKNTPNAAKFIPGEHYPQAHLSVMGQILASWSAYDVPIDQQIYSTSTPSTIPFSAFAQEEYTGGDFSEKKIILEVVTSYLTVNVCGMPEEAAIDVVGLGHIGTGINWEFEGGELTYSTSSANAGTITLLCNGNVSSSKKGVRTFYFAIPKSPAYEGKRILSVSTMDGNAYGGTFSSSALDGGSYFSQTIEVKQKEGVQLYAGGPFWDSCNIGATAPDENGWYFSFANVTPYVPVSTNNNWEEVENPGTILSGGFSKANYQTTPGYSITKIVPNTEEYDAARKYRGEGWRLPTKDEITNLKKQCVIIHYDGSSTKYKESTKKGCAVFRKIEGKAEADYSPLTDAHVFFPHAGTNNGSNPPYFVGNNSGVYMSNEKEESNNYGYYLYIASSSFGRESMGAASGAYSVRAVTD